MTDQDAMFYDIIYATGRDPVRVYRPTHFIFNVFVVFNVYVHFLVFLFLLNCHMGHVVRNKTDVFKLLLFYYKIVHVVQNNE